MDLNSVGSLRPHSPSVAANPKSAVPGQIGRHSFVQVLAEAPRAIGRALSNFAGLLKRTIAPAKPEDRVRAGIQQGLGKVKDALRNLTDALSASDGGKAERTLIHLQKSVDHVVAHGGNRGAVLGACLQGLGAAGTAALYKAIQSSTTPRSAELAQLCDVLSARITVAKAMEKVDALEANIDTASPKSLMQIKNAADLLLKSHLPGDQSIRLDDLKRLSHIAAVELAVRVVSSLDRDADSIRTMSTSPLIEAKAAIILLLQPSSGIDHDAIPELQELRDVVQATLSLKLIDTFLADVGQATADLAGSDEAAMLTGTAKLTAALHDLQLHASIEAADRTGSRQSQVLDAYRNSFDSAMQAWDKDDFAHALHHLRVASQVLKLFETL